MNPIRKLASRVFWRLAILLSSESAKAKPEWVSVKSGPLAGRWLYLDRNHGWSHDFAEGTYDAHIYDFLAELGLPKTGETIWDIGSFVGYYSMVFASQAGPSGQVIAIEPNPAAVDYLIRNLNKNPELKGIIQVENIAVSNTDGQQKFHCSEEFLDAPLGYLDSSGPPSERISPNTYRTFQTVDTHVYRVDSLLQKGFPPPTLMKIDVEGAELLVLEGAAECLRLYRPTLLMEIHNIKAMFAVQEFLLSQAEYETKLIEHPITQSSSRAFIFARPRPNGSQ